MTAWCVLWRMLDKKLIVFNIGLEVYCGTMVASLHLADNCVHFWHLLIQMCLPPTTVCALQH